jgi:hypothetical protein
LCMHPPRVLACSLLYPHFDNFIVFV